MYMHLDDDDSELIDTWDELDDNDMEDWSFYDLLDDDIEFVWSEMSHHRFGGAR